VYQVYAHFGTVKRQKRIRDMKSTMTALGLMSGTSMDGIDAALIHTDGEGLVRMGPFFGRDYGEEERGLLRQALADATAVKQRDDRPGVLAAAERLVTGRHADIVADFLKKNSLGAGDIDIVGFHGQTVLHRPHERVTVQIGDGQALADAIGLPVVYDLRA